MINQIGFSFIRIQPYSQFKVQTSRLIVGTYIFQIIYLFLFTEIISIAGKPLYIYPAAMYGRSFISDSLLAIGYHDIMNFKIVKITFQITLKKIN